MKSMKKLCFTMVSAVILVICIACSLSSITVNAESVSINKKSLKLIKGQSYQLKINAAGGSTEWSSSNKKVASVSSNGKVTVKKKGTAVITGKAGGKKYTCKVTGYNVLSKKQAETAAANYCEKQRVSFYYNEAVKDGNQYIVWVHYRQTGMMSKFVVNAKTGKAVSYAPYFGVDMPAVDNPKVEYRFSALNYL